MKKEALFIVDNSEDKAEGKFNGLDYLKQWCEISRKFDVATGYFDISALNALDGQWQKLEEIRVLMGDEMTGRTGKALLEAIAKILKDVDDGIEREKNQDVFMQGVAAIVEGIRSGKIKCRIYNKQKFHAKAYITYSKAAVAPPVALVGSSNFTYSGLTRNLELNVQISSVAEVQILQDWYEKHWEDAQDISAEIIAIIEKHIREYLPYEVYLKSLYEFYKGHEVTVSEWEKNDSIIYKEISMYQKEAYHSLMKISQQWTGAFLCDGVGLGKTFVGLMLIERLVDKEHKKVVLLVPKSGRESVWEENIKRYLPHLLNNPYVSLKIYNHTDLTREASERNWPEEFEHIKNTADVFIIDEGHNFRNRPTSRYKKLYDLLAGGKKLFLLTATPINNSLIDLKNQIDLFAQRDDAFFSKPPIGINNLTSFFGNKEKELIKITSGDEIPDDMTRDLLGSEQLFKNIIVQRSRAYVVKSLKLENRGDSVLFPDRADPQVANYSLKKIYGTLLTKVESAFDSDKPLLRLPVYSLYDKDKKGKFIYFIGDEKKLTPFQIGRSVQVVALIKVLLLKRLESSVVAFRDTCENLLLKLLSFIDTHDEDTAKLWKDQNIELYNKIIMNKNLGEEDEDEDSTLPEELRFNWTVLPSTDFNVSKIISATLLDLKELADFLIVLENFDSSKDDKIQTLIKLLQTDPDLKSEKVIIFTEFMSTARYIEETLNKNKFKDVFEIDSSFKGDRGQVIKRFAPFYNKTSPAELKLKNLLEIKVLIATDVLSEGINLQDARLLINYDLHWNPVRLMQRIGRVDRRMDSKIEAEIVKHNPSLKTKRGKVRFWNFLPPEELNTLLSLWSKVKGKTLKISKVFGIENKKLLRHDDDYDIIKEFNHDYEGETTAGEEIKLKFQKLLVDEPTLEGKLNAFPLKVFSGKSTLKTDTIGVFFCYKLPINKRNDDGSFTWSLKEGITSWYFYLIDKKETLDDFFRINDIISCEKDEKRVVKFEQKSLIEIKKSVEKHIHNTYYKTSQIPVQDEEGNSLKPFLLAWMEVN